MKGNPSQENERALLSQSLHRQTDLRHRLNLPPTSEEPERLEPLSITLTKENGQFFLVRYINDYLKKKVL